MRCAKALGQVAPADVESSRQRIANGCSLRHHGDARHTSSRFSGSRIDNVAIALAVMLKELLFAAAG